MPNTHIRFDWAMKSILRQKANFGILEGFLSELLAEDVKILEILESESNKTFEDDKFNRVDILVKDSKGALVIIEVQTQAEIDYFLRILYGVSKAITEFIREGERYAKIKKVISISILFSDVGVGQDYVYKGETEFIGLHLKDKLQLTERQKKYLQQETPQNLFPVYYLINVDKFDKQLKDGLDEWIYFFRNSEIKETFKAKGLREAAEKLRVAFLSEKERREYHAAMRAESDKRSRAWTEWIENEEMELAFRLKEKNKIAVAAIQNGLDNELIAKVTELSVEQIEELRKNTINP